LVEGEVGWDIFALLSVAGPVSKEALIGSLSWFITALPILREPEALY